MRLEEVNVVYDSKLEKIESIHFLASTAHAKCSKLREENKTYNYHVASLVTALAWLKHAWQADVKASIDMEDKEKDYRQFAGHEAIHI